MRKSVTTTPETLTMTESHSWTVMFSCVFKFATTILTTLGTWVKGISWKQTIAKKRWTDKWPTCRKCTTAIPASIWRRCLSRTMLLAENPNLTRPKATQFSTTTTMATHFRSKTWPQCCNVWTSAQLSSQKTFRVARSPSSNTLQQNWQNYILFYWLVAKRFISGLSSLQIFLTLSKRSLLHRMIKNSLKKSPSSVSSIWQCWPMKKDSFSFTPFCKGSTNNGKTTKLSELTTKYPKSILRFWNIFRLSSKSSASTTKTILPKRSLNSSFSTFSQWITTKTLTSKAKSDLPTAH